MSCYHPNTRRFLDEATYLTVEHTHTRTHTHTVTHTRIPIQTFNKTKLPGEYHSVRFHSIAQPNQPRDITRKNDLPLFQSFRPTDRRAVVTRMTAVSPRKKMSHEKKRLTKQRQKIFSSKSKFMYFQKLLNAYVWADQKICLICGDKVFNEVPHGRCRYPPCWFPAGTWQVYNTIKFV